jgi:very-short-patch-repair endonuclease
VRNTRGKTTTLIVRAARQQRRQQTAAEARLWAALRGSQLGGKFRRQHPYDRCVLDFFCVESQIAVELDGGVHADPSQATYDAERTAHLESFGIRVLRFTNEQVENDLDAVLAEIKAAIASRVRNPL